MSRRPGWTRRRVSRCGRPSGNSPRAARPCCSPPSTWTRPNVSPAGSRSSTRAGSSSPEPWPSSNGCSRPPGPNTPRDSPLSRTSSSPSSAPPAKTTRQAAQEVGKEQQMATHFFGDTAVLTGRTMRHVTRSPDTIITTAIMPIAIMALFVYVFGGAIDTGSASYVNYMLPGILLITIASGISYTAFRLFTDIQGGIFERFQTMPIARPGVLWALVLTSLAANVISLALVVGVAVAMGFRSGAGPLAWLAVAGILILFTLALTWIAVMPGLTAKSVDGASAFSYPLIFLPFISSAFVPTRTMPGPVRAFADNQPVTSVVNTIRDLFAKQPVSTGIWIALAWCLGILVVGYTLAMATYHRKVA